jgi:murein L,D-transpeptidase YafK
MKSLNTLVTFIIITCLLLLASVSFGATAASQANQSSRAAGELSQLFEVAVAKEPIYLILIEKDLQRLRVLEFDDGLKVVAEYFSATGENFGIKEVKGDSKTPEGVYFITQIFRDDEITIFGDKAFHLDYPNFFDRKAARNGDGIYIHGTNKELLPNSTNGCVTLANSDLDDLEKYLNQVVTPVVIVQELDSIKTNINLLTENDFRQAKSLLLTEGINPENVEYNYLYVISFGGQTVAVSDFIYRPFSRSIMRGASRTYLQHFPDQGWTAAKRIWRASPLHIYPEGPSKIAAHPLATGEEQLAELTDEGAAALVAALSPPRKSAKNVAVEKKQHPVQPVKQQTTPQVQKKVQVEKPALPEGTKQHLAKAPAAQSSITPSPQAETEKKIKQPEKIAVRAPAITKDKQQLIDFVESWKQAWISQEIEPYIAFYDSSFRSGDKDLAAWKKHKANINNSYAFINVDISNIKVRWTDHGAAVSFRQQYRSDRYNATGNKTLYLIHNDLGWKIKSEIYSRI